MIELVITTLIWSLSFPLIGIYLARDIDPYISIFIRFFIAFIVLVPFIRFKNMPKELIIKLMGIGMIQVGFMYIAFYHSFLFLTVPEVVLFTVFTPIYVTLFNDILNKKVVFKFLISSSIAVVGAIVIKWTQVSDKYLIGFLIVQIFFSGWGRCYIEGQ